MINIYINQQPVELYKILKFENLVNGGGEAKIMITQGMVQLNGQIATQKRKKVYHGDILTFQQQVYQILLGDAEPQHATTPPNQLTQPPTATHLNKRSKIKF